MTFKNILMPALVGVLFLGACETAESKPKPVMDLVGTSWLAEDIGGTGVAGDTRSTLTFVEPGKVAGRGGCNRFFGAVTTDGTTIEFGNLGSTMMACPEPFMDQEKRYFEALGKAKRFEAEDGMLLIFGDGPDPLVRFFPDPSGPK